MCGIFAYISETPINYPLLQAINIEGMKCKSRGPDNTVTRKISENTFLMFHRLKINDMSDLGNQPISHPDDYNLTLICNGEIYNHKKLISENNFYTKSSSDCEVILHMYKKYGINKTIKSLDGVFAFLLIDNSKNKIFIGRDPIGIRSLYIGKDKPNSILIGSECKTLSSICKYVTPFFPGKYLAIDFYNIPKNINNLDYITYYDYIYPTIHYNKEVILDNIYSTLNRAIEKRMISDRPIGCLLSGGLDSSLITALVAKQFNKKELCTFSIGFEGSEDLKYAKIVANHLNTKHHEYIVTEQMMIQALEEVIKGIETYDITTIRASVPMYLLSKYIKNNTDITVLFSGEGSDEASGSYMYFHNAPDADSFNNETVRLLKDLQYFDVLRSDKSTACNGLEVRVPFLDKEFLQYYMQIDPHLKIPNGKIEKFLLRKAFDDGLLPDEILWRSKEAFSDGVSSKKKSWFTILQEHIDNEISDEEFETRRIKYTHNTPTIKEALYYREIFHKYFPNNGNIIPYYWLPKWNGDIKDPSARVLKVYK
jgi:asparagine synthase (glutamine-hydrolysing)